MEKNMSEKDIATSEPVEKPEVPVNAEPQAEEVEPFISSSQMVGDMMEEDLGGSDPIEEASDEELEKLAKELVDDEEETETSESEEDDSDPLDEETDDLDALISKRAQKRIDKLTAESKAAKDQNQELLDRIAKLEKLVEGKPEEKKDAPKKDRISDEQINKAIEKGIEDGDMSVITDAINYKIQAAIEDTLAAEEKKAQEAAQATVKKQQEWQTLQKEYSPETYQYEALKSDPDFNLSDRNSLLFRLADKLYLERGYSNKDNGQSGAVREAYSILLERKLGSNKPKSQNKETDGLKQRLTKEQRRKTLLGGKGSGGGEISKKEVSLNNELDDYISSRASEKHKKLGLSTF